MASFASYTTTWRTQARLDIFGRVWLFRSWEKITDGMLFVVSKENKANQTWVELDVAI